MLIEGAGDRIRDALDAWTDEDHAKVAIMAPVAVEQLGKATLWRTNPVLLVQLRDSSEATLFRLATAPDLAAAGVKTISLSQTLTRLVRLLGELPIPEKHQHRIADVRNGAVHVGAGQEARFVLLDSLAVIDVLLPRLGIDRASFYGVHTATVDALLDQRRDEIAHEVTRLMARARAWLARQVEVRGRKAFNALAEERESAAFVFLPGDREAVEVECPVCGRRGKLSGAFTASGEVDVDVEPIGGGEYETVAMPYWQLTLSPDSFSCAVCPLELESPQELAAAGLPSEALDVEADQLGPDFRLEEYVQALHSDY